jgi:hypothetical protein
MPMISPIRLWEGLNCWRYRGKRRKRLMLMKEKKYPKRAKTKYRLQIVLIFSLLSFPQKTCVRWSSLLKADDNVKCWLFLLWGK